MFDAIDERLVWIERDLCPRPRPHWPGDTAYTRVTVDGYTPSDEGLWAGIPLRSIGTPTSRGMGRAAVAALIDATTPVTPRA